MGLWYDAAKRHADATMVCMAEAKEEKRRSKFLHFCQKLILCSASDRGEDVPTIVYNYTSGFGGVNVTWHPKTAATRMIGDFTSLHVLQQRSLLDVLNGLYRAANFPLPLTTEGTERECFTHATIKRTTSAALPPPGSEYTIVSAIRGGCNDGGGGQAVMSTRVSHCTLLTTESRRLSRWAI